LTHRENDHDDDRGNNNEGDADDGQDAGHGGAFP
jgi:hypothetical protein